MRESLWLIAILLAAAAAQPLPPPGEYTLAGAVPPLTDPSASAYQKFFREVSDLRVLTLSDEARKTLHFSNQELHSLVMITVDLATESRAIEKEEKKWLWETRMEAIDEDGVTPPLVKYCTLRN